MDETYIKINGEWKYLYRAVDKKGQIIDFSYVPTGTRLRRGDALRRPSHKTVYRRR